MRLAVVNRLLKLNQNFYEQFADAFAQSRVGEQPGFRQLLNWLPIHPAQLLDVGCGDGRLGRYLQTDGQIQSYTGVDFSQKLLQLAQSQTVGSFYQRDISQPGCLAGLGQFEVVACLATLQHIPGRANRLRLLREMAAHLPAHGRILLANWQFMESPRQRRKLCAWEKIGLTEQNVEAHDYLLSWQRGGMGWRYVCWIDAAETKQLAENAGTFPLHQFYQDGKEGNLNLYTILEKKEK